MKGGVYVLVEGPFYIPAKYSNTAEIVGLARAAAPFPHAIYTSHVRDEGNYNIGVVEAVEEVITVAREAKIPGVVTHIKVLGHKRSEERRVGKECGSTCRSRWSRYH